MSNPNEVLVVASKVKGYIKERGEMKTSSSVLAALSDRIRRMCDEAIESARSDGRKTVLDRDIG
jgi:histone H3/H4